MAEGGIATDNGTLALVILIVVSLLLTISLRKYRHGFPTSHDIEVFDIDNIIIPKLIIMAPILS